jgi:hypothetical protein
MTPTRSISGAIWRSSCIHLPPIDRSQTTKPVTFPPGRETALDQAETHWISNLRKNDWYRACLLMNGSRCRQPLCVDQIWAEPDEFGSRRFNFNEIAAAKAVDEVNVFTIDPAHVLHLIFKGPKGLGANKFKML